MGYSKLSPHAPDDTLLEFRDTFGLDLHPQDPLESHASKGPTPLRHVSSVALSDALEHANHVNVIPQLLNSLRDAQTETSDQGPHHPMGPRHATYPHESTATHARLEDQNNASAPMTLNATNKIYSVDQVVTQLTETGWGRSSPMAFASNSISVNLTGLTADGKQLAQWALQAWEDVSNLQFTETSGSADITFDDNAAGAFAGPDSISGGGVIHSASVNVSQNWVQTYGTTIGSYSFLTYLHEIGHALGLAHAGQYNGTATYGVDNVFLNDSYQMTLMSYFSAAENTYINGSQYNPITPMIADVAAIWELYGTPSNVNSGNTVWGASSNLPGVLGSIMGVMFDGEPSIWGVYNASDDVGFTIVDTGGQDLLDLSNTSQSQRVDMRPGGISNISGGVGNMVVSEGTILENYKGGSGADKVFANSAPNTVYGGNGNDTVYGGAGNDVIYGESGQDSLTGNGGHDYLDGGTGYDTLHGQSGNDTLHGMLGKDHLYGGTGSDYLSGGSYHDYIDGGDGTDSLFGGSGNDTLHGMAGNDHMYGDSDDDYLSGSSGYDRIEGGSGNDRMFGGSESDTLIGDDGKDYMDGGTGNDGLYGGADADTLHGMSGNDSLYGGSGNDYMTGSTGNDLLSGNDNNDYLNAGSGADLLKGGNGNDTLHGMSGNDHMYGDSDDDYLSGGSGSDTIDGGSGADRIYGGGSADQFIFKKGNQADTVHDFQNDVDEVSFQGFGFTSVSQAMATATQVGTSVVFNLGAGDTLTITDSTISDLTNDILV